MTGGYGCDIYIEATGHPSSVQQGLDCIRKMGRFVEFSVFGQPVTVDWSIISDEKNLTFLAYILAHSATIPLSSGSATASFQQLA